MLSIYYIISAVLDSGKGNRGLNEWNQTLFSIITCLWNWSFLCISTADLSGLHGFAKGLWDNLSWKSNLLKARVLIKLNVFFFIILMSFWIDWFLATSEELPWKYFRSLNDLQNNLAAAISELWNLSCYSNTDRAFFFFGTKVRHTSWAVASFF